MPAREGIGLLERLCTRGGGLKVAGLDFHNRYVRNLAVIVATPRFFRPATDTKETTLNVRTELRPVSESAPAAEAAVPLTLRINGHEHRLLLDPRTTLLDCLRETLALTGTKKGCDHGHCGPCTRHVNGRRVELCLILPPLPQRDDVAT